jgi:hypothetical protein
VNRFRFGHRNLAQLTRPDVDWPKEAYHQHRRVTGPFAFPSSSSLNKCSVHLAYNPSYLACFFSQNSIFLSQKISQ